MKNRYFAFIVLSSFLSVFSCNGAEGNQKQSTATQAEREAIIKLDNLGTDVLAIPLDNSEEEELQEEEMLQKKSQAYETASQVKKK